MSDIRIPPTPDWLEYINDLATKIMAKTNRRVRSITMDGDLGFAFGCIPGESCRVATAGGIVILRFTEFAGIDT